MVLSMPLFKAAMLMNAAPLTPPNVSASPKSTTTPSSSTPTNIPMANLPFGSVITTCTEPNTMALTFDDGPSKFSTTLLQKLKENDIKATFFITGLNGDNGVEGGSVDAKALLPQIMQEGHQIASHTFSHPSLDTLSQDQIQEEMVKLDNDLIKFMGKAPTFMRPPFYASNDVVMKAMKKMQYLVVTSDLDTNDWNFTTPENNFNALDNLKKGIAKKGTIILMHEIHDTSVNMLLPAAIPLLKKTGKKLVTVGECLKIPKEQWYREKSVVA